MINRGEEDKYYMENHHQPIVPLNVYEKAHSILEKRSGAKETGRRKGNYSRKFPFSSRVFCGFCGTVFVRRNLYNNTNYEQKVWQCMSYVKNGKKDCAHSKVIKEEIVENCFTEAYRILCNNNKDIIKKFLDRMDRFFIENNTKNILEKLDSEKQVFEQKINSLLNLLIDGTIDKELYNAKKIELNKKISKIEKEQEQYSCQMEDEQQFDSGIDKIKEIFNYESDNYDKFDKDIFEALIHKVVIGEIDENSVKNPYVIKFIIKSGFENTKDKIDDNIRKNILDGDSRVLDFYSWQKFVSFEKQEDGSLQKKMRTKMRVKVELNV